MLKRNLLLVVLYPIILCSCKKDVSNHSERAMLFERMNGKYGLVQAIGDKSVDINLDGLSSNDLMTEIPDLAKFDLELIIKKDTDINLFAMWWPEQKLYYVDQQIPPTVYYARESYPFTFKVDDDEKHLLLDDSKITAAEAEAYIVPESIEIVDKDLVEIHFTKKIFSNGTWQEIKIKTQYKKKTQVT